MTMTCWPASVVFVWTSCCALVLSVPTVCACSRSFWMLLKTALRSAVKTSPSLVVQVICCAMAPTTGGQSVGETELWPDPAFTPPPPNLVAFHPADHLH